MTEPQPGPEDQPGYPSGSPTPTGPARPAGSGEVSGQGQPDLAPGSGPAGATAAGQPQPDTGGVTTAGRTTGPAGVPPQYSRASDRGYGSAEAGAESDTGIGGLGSGSALIQATAGRAWWAVLVGGLALIAVGVILLVWPKITLSIVAVLIGAALVVSGVVKLWEGFTARADSGAMRAAYVVIGLLAVIAGVYCIKDHALTLFLIAFVTGLYFILHGISDLGVAMSASGVPGRGLRAVLGVVSLAAGIVMIVWPSITLVLLFTIVAAWLLFYGLMLCFLAYELRRMGKRADAELTGTTGGRPVAAATG